MSKIARGTCHDCGVGFTRWPRETWTVSIGEETITLELCRRCGRRLRAARGAGQAAYRKSLARIAGQMQKR